jgi:hypothetical protein
VVIECWRWNGQGWLDSHHHVRLKSDRPTPFPQAVTVTACGNFGLAGSSTGHIKLWNMQSGQERKTFYLGGAPPAKTKANKARKAVSPGKAVTGLATDGMNRTLVASTLDGALHVSPAVSCLSFLDLTFHTDALVLRFSLHYS